MEATNTFNCRLFACWKPIVSSLMQGLMPLSITINIAILVMKSTKENQYSTDWEIFVSIKSLSGILFGIKDIW